MKKIIIVLLVIGIGYLGYVKFKESPTMVNDFLSKIDNNAGDKTESKAVSIKELVASGKSQKCNWKIDESGITTEGSLWIDGNKFKQEIVTTEGESKKVSKVMVISDGKYSYMWNTDMGKNGVKTAINEDQKQDYTAENGKADWDKQYQFECKNESVSEADLTPPSDIVFQDLGAQLQELQKLQEGLGR